MLGLIRGTTLHHEEDIHRHGAWFEGRYGIHVRSRCIPDQLMGYRLRPRSLNRFPKLWIWHENWNRKAVRPSVSVVQPIRLLQECVPLFTSRFMELDHVPHILRLHQRRV